MRQAFLSTSSKADTIKGKRFCRIKKDCCYTFTSHLPETRKSALIIQVLSSLSSALTFERQGSGSPAHLTLNPGLCNGPSMFGDKLPAFVVQPRGALCLVRHSSGQRKRTARPPPNSTPQQMSAGTTHHTCGWRHITRVDEDRAKCLPSSSTKESHAPRNLAPRNPASRRRAGKWRKTRWKANHIGTERDTQTSLILITSLAFTLSIQKDLIFHCNSGLFPPKYYIHSLRHQNF